MAKWKPRHDDGTPDHRYSVRLEFCGHNKQRWVARFCGEWLGVNDFRQFADSAKLCTDHHERRMAGLG